MSDREEDFGFETESEEKSSPFDVEEEFSIGLSEDEEEFTLESSEEDDGPFEFESEKTLDVDEPVEEDDFILESSEEDDAGFALAPEENPGFEDPVEDEQNASLFTMASDDSVEEVADNFATDEVFIEDLGDDVPPEKKSSPMRLLLLVGLLVVIGAGAFFFLGMPETPSGSSPAPVASKKQPIAIPNQPVVKPIAKTEPPAAVKQEPAAPVVVEKVVAPPVKPAVPAEPVRQKPAKVAAAKVEEARPAAKPAPAAVVQTAAAVTPKYQVQAGAFLLAGNLKQAQKQVKKLGFEPKQTETRKTMPMVRLRYGRFDKAAGPAKLAELKKTVPGAFLIYDGEQAVVYAGSYLSLDKARRHADLLWEKGVKVEEVTAEVEVPLHRLSFGGFADKKSAEAAAKKARTTGLDAQVVAYKQ